MEGTWWAGEPRSLCIVAPSLGGLPAAGGCVVVLVIGLEPRSYSHTDVTDNS